MHVGLTWDLACVHVGTNEQRFIKRKKNGQHSIPCGHAVLWVVGHWASGRPSRLLPPVW
jgi:hypothetical protein